MDDRVLVVGLPRSGKTTFLAALWHVVNQTEVSTSLKLRELKGDYKHLNFLRDMWLQRKEFERTKLGDEKTVLLRLEAPDRGAVLDLSFPDYSGETFRRLWRDRMCAQTLATEVSNASSILLFIHADNFVQPWMLTDVNAALGVDSSQQSSVTPPTKFDANKSPTQVQIVDLLQFMQRPPLGPLPRRLAIVLSAWDKVEKHKRTPEQWLAEKLPFLDQFLKSNGEAFQVAVFGVSAQGGDYESDAAKLDKVVVQSERIKVLNAGTESHDISRPVFWALGL